MIIGWFLAAFVAALDGLQSMVDAHGSDFAFSQNVNIQAVLSYLLQANHFFPMDTYFVIAGLYGSVYGLLTVFRVARIVYGAFPFGGKLEI